MISKGRVTRIGIFFALANMLLVGIVLVVLSKRFERLKSQASLLVAIGLVSVCELSWLPSGGGHKPQIAEFLFTFFVDPLYPEDDVLAIRRKPHLPRVGVIVGGSETPGGPVGH